MNRRGKIASYEILTTKKNSRVVYSAEKYKLIDQSDRIRVEAKDGSRTLFFFKSNLVRLTYIYESGEQ